MTTIGAIVLVMAGMGVFCFPRFCLRKEHKLTSQQLAALDARYDSIKSIYLYSGIFVGLLTWGIMFQTFCANLSYWRDWSVILSAPVLWLAVMAMFEALFALSTSVFPGATTRNRDGFVADPDHRLRWVAYWQLGLALLLLAADVVLYVVTR